MKKLLTLFFVLAFAGSAAAATLAPWTYDAAAPFAPEPADGAIAFNDGAVIYSANQDVYSMSAVTTTVICDPDLVNGPHSANAWAPSGLLVSYDGARLFFHDNGNPTTHIFTYEFGDAADDYSAFDSQCQGSIFSLAQNPWTDALWFASAGTTDLYLYEVLGEGDDQEAVLRATIAKNGDPATGSGPIIFKGPNAVLLGETEAEFSGDDDGFFHLVDSATGEVIVEDYLFFDNGLSAATYGYNNEIFAATGDGKQIYKVSHDNAQAVVTTTDGVRGFAFSGEEFFVLEQDWSTWPATTSSGVLTNPEAATVVTPSQNWRTASLPLPAPGFFAWNSSMAAYGTSLVHAAQDGNIHLFDQVTGGDDQVVDVDFSAGSANANSPAAFTWGSDGYLYFHDNGNPTTFVYRTKPGVQGYETLDLGAVVSGSIFSIANNPWTESIWLASAQGTDFLLYELTQAFDGVANSFVISKTTGDAGNGPIIFKDEDTCLFGESKWFGTSYFHEINVATGAVVTNAIAFEGGLTAAVKAFDNDIYAVQKEGASLVKVDAKAKTVTEVAKMATGVSGLAFDGATLYLKGSVFDLNTFSEKMFLDAFWKVIDNGVPADQQADAGAVDAASELAVNAAYGTGAVGIEGSANTFVQSLKTVDITALATTAGMPDNLPYGLVDFRVKGDAAPFTATITVHFSSALPDDAQWWKYDDVNGWRAYPNAVLAADGMSMVITIVDGGDGDSDGMVNGYVVDPGGPGFGDDKTSASGGSGGDDCFIGSCSAQAASAASMGLGALAAFLAGLWLTVSGRRNNRPEA